MAETRILASAKVAKLETLVEEASRSTDEGVKRFIEPASGTLSRAISKQHHLIFGRRGSGKSSLLRKTASDLTIDRRPIAFVDLETFKGHAYPDVLLSVLIETFRKFAEWLETAAIAPGNKTSFWSRLFGSKPTRKPFDRDIATSLANDLRTELQHLRTVLFAEDESEITASESRKTGRNSTTGVRAEIGDKVLKLTGEESKGATGETSTSITETFNRSKLDYLHRHILDYQELFRRMGSLSGGDSYLILDDLYHLRKKDQPSVVDYFHRLAKGNRLWLKIGTIRHRSQWYVNGDPPVGAKLGDDIQEVDLDLTLERYASTRSFLSTVLRTFLGEAELLTDDILTDGALDRLVLASGGVTRDFLGILRKSIIIARERGDSFRGEKIGAEDVNNASGEYDSSKREELSRDTIDDTQNLQDEFTEIVNFARDYANANVFLVDRQLPDHQIEAIEELVDLRLIHRIKGTVTVSDRPGKKFEAFMLDLSQYSASRKKREFELIEFWRPDATDKIRRPGLIYKELVDGEVVSKSSRKRT